MQIGELSQRTGVSVRMLRYYEAEGLLQPQRRESGYRDYGSAEEVLVRRIRQLQESGLRLSVIKPLLPCLRRDRQGFTPCAKALTALQREINELDVRIAHLNSSRNILAGYLDEANSSQS